MIILIILVILDVIIYKVTTKDYDEESDEDWMEDQI